MKIFPATLIIIVSLLSVSCSKKSDVDGGEKGDSRSPAEQSSANEFQEFESDVAPEPEEIGEDCVGFLRATQAIPPHRENKDCPACPANDAAVEVLKFNTFKIDRISPSGSSCEVDVRIHAEFNPSSGGTITGGLIGWISPEQREQYAHGKTPPGPQVYKVKITYKRTDDAWRAIEFAPGSGD